MLSAHRQREDHSDLHRWHNNNFHSSNYKCGWGEAVKRKSVRRDAFSFQLSAKRKVNPTIPHGLHGNSTDHWEVLRELPEC